MGFFKRIAQMFAGNPAPTGGDVGLYYYVRLKRSGRVVKLRINRNNDLTHNDSGGGYFVTKMVAVSWDRAEVTLHFDANRKLTDSDIDGGTLVDEEAYLADQEAHPNN